MSHFLLKAFDNNLISKFDYNYLNKSNINDFNSNLNQFSQQEWMETDTIMTLMNCSGFKLFVLYKSNGF